MDSRPTEGNNDQRAHVSCPTGSSRCASLAFGATPIGALSHSTVQGHITTTHNSALPRVVEVHRTKPLCVKSQCSGAREARRMMPLSTAGGSGLSLSWVRELTDPKCRCSGFSRPRWIRVAPDRRPGLVINSWRGRRFGVVARRRRRSAVSMRGVLLCGSCLRLGGVGSRRVRVCRERLG